MNTEIETPLTQKEEIKHMKDLRAIGLAGPESHYPADPDPKPEKTNEPPPLFNRSAVRHHALKVSRETRAGKFERVSQEFIDNVISQTEQKLRSFQFPVTSAVGQVEPEVQFLTGAGRKRLAELFNVWIAREIHRQANNVRVGKTL
jgi:hypothetical protein